MSMIAMQRARSAAVRRLASTPTAPRALLSSFTPGNDRPTTLVMEDGTRVTGKAFGAYEPSSFEIVFNTGMTGYNEAITDPSYRGQGLTFTYPLQGNYGSPPHQELDRFGLTKYYEAPSPQVAAVIATHYSKEYSHWEATQSLGDWLTEFGVPAIHGVDTRMLTKLIRERGAMKAKLVPEGVDEDAVPFVDINAQNLVADVSPDGVKTYRPDEAVEAALQQRGRRPVHVLAVDMGMKHSILRALLTRGATVTVVPWDHAFAAELALPQYDALFLSNGPGDPATLQGPVDELRKVIGAERVKPVFGICLGHQLLSTAAGASTYKLPYGHRSQNQPCIDVFSRRCFITSQNHGFAVDDSNLTGGWQPYFVNANDLTSEGLVHQERPFFSVQFHPEAKCGPVDTTYLFDDFLDIARGLRSHSDILNGRTGQRPLTRSEKERLPAQSDGGAAGAERPTLGSTMAASGRLEDHISLLADPERPAIGQEGLSQAVATTTLSSGAKAGAGGASDRTLADLTESPLYRKRHKVLILGSGGLQIGQAGEFDYSGSQAIKALNDEGVRTVLINPNIATVQTAEGLADSVYFLPVTKEFVTSIIEKERPDGIMLQFGGQTALNCGIELHDTGVLERFGVEVLGTSVETIRATEDRQIFADKLNEINESIAPSISATTVKDAAAAAAEIGYPVIVRSAFSLGGLGSGFAKDEVELRDLVTRALTASPQVLVEKSIKGWKELEYEVVRDMYDNTCVTCNMENFDPLGVHTGDSIVIAPSQTLNDHEYHMLRQASINVVRHLGIVGECNVQFALSPDSRDYCIIECNPRLSRSSALASKATGYPLALVAAKLALGHSLPSVVNAVNHTTTANFEPSLDYVVTKMPRWDLQKFSNVSRQLGSGMKSVGEVMAVGRTFEESLQKALRMVDKGVEGFVDSPDFKFPKNLDKVMENPTDERVWALARAMRAGYDVERLHQITKIDRWFLQRLANIHRMGEALRGGGAARGAVGELDAATVRAAKELGFSDRQIADDLPFDATADEVRAHRKGLGVVPYVKQIDTLAAEFPAKANYLYLTYHGAEHDVPFTEDAVNKDDVMVLGGGGYRIGSSVEFDCSAVGAIRTLRALGKSTSMVNFNPETVSTDFDESDRLFFDELSLERVLDIHDLQRPEGTVVSVGGQIPNTLALPLAQRGVRLLGTSAEMIDNAEDRRKFSDLLDGIGVGQPDWSQLTDLASARDFCGRVGYPVLVRPSYVLSGGGMKVVNDDDELVDWLDNAGAVVSSEFPVVVSKMVEGREIDFDGVAYKGEVLAYAVSEHIERAGVHSGDATLAIPSPNVSDELAASVLDIGKRMAKALNITGPFNSQIIAPDGAGDSADALKVIECNLRASRSLPFVSKALGVDFVELATRAMVDAGDLRPIDSYRPDLGYVCVKSPMFSFTRLLGADPLLGVEMASTGEVACFGKTLEEAFVKSMMAATFKLPNKNILLSTGSEANKEMMLPYVRKLVGMGYKLYATPGTATHLEDNDVECETCYFELGGEGKHPKAVALLAAKDIDLVVNVPSTDKKDRKDEKSNCYLVRRAAVDYSVPLVTNLEVFKGLITSLSSVTDLTTASYTDIKEIKALALEAARK